MKLIALLSICIVSACGRPEAPTASEAKPPTKQTTEVSKTAPQPAAALEPAAEKKPVTKSADTSASEAYHTTALAGRAGFPPGSGALTEIPDRDRKAMVSAAVTFFEAARAENVDAMRDVSTQLFTTNLLDNMDRYRERFYRGLTDSLDSSRKGVSPGEVRMPDEGHFEIELKFGDGESRRIMMAVESGHWRVNRL